MPVRSPFSFAECHWLLNRNFDDCTHRITTGAVRKALNIGGRLLLVGITGGTDALQVEELNGEADAEETAAIASYVSEWFDAGRDLKPFYRLLKRHPALAYMAREFRGLRLMGMPDLFEAIAWAIIGQQINLSFAYRLKRRLVEQYGEALTFEDERYYLFPTPAAIAPAAPEALREMQFSAGKATYLTGVARGFADGHLSRALLAALPTTADRLARLTSIRGIGTWTANYAMMKCLREPTAIPHGDAGLYNALKAHGIIKNKRDTEAIEALFRQFSGWESYLVVYPWHSLSVPGTASR